MKPVLRHPSPYKRGTGNGAFFGIYLAAMFLASAHSLSQPALSVVTMLLAVGVPPTIYFLLRRSYMSAPTGSANFMSLWVEGITIFFCGGLIASLVAVIYMKFINPGLIYQQVSAAITLYQSMGDAPEVKEILTALTRMRDEHLLPTATALAADMMWLIVFSGSVLSMIEAAIVHAVGRPNNKKAKN